MVFRVVDFLLHQLRDLLGRLWEVDFIGQRVPHTQGCVLARVRPCSTSSRSGLVQLTKQENGGGGADAGESALSASLCGMLDADNGRVASQSPEQPRKMMGVIVVACAAFGLTVSEVKTNFFSPEPPYSAYRQPARRTTKQTSSYTSGETAINHNADRRIHSTSCSFQKYTLELYDRRSAPLQLKIRMLEAEALEAVLYGCVACATTTRYAEPTTAP